MNSLLQMVEAFFLTRAKCLARALGERNRLLVQGEVRPGWGAAHNGLAIPVFSGRVVGAVLVAASGLFAAYYPTTTDVVMKQFTPDSLLANYSVYATEYIGMPVNSGTADSGWFGCGGNIFFNNSAHLRSPVLTAHGDLTINGVTNGSKDTTPAFVSVSGTLTLKTNAVTFLNKVMTRYISVEANDVTFKNKVFALGLDVKARARVYDVVNVDTFTTRELVAYEPNSEVWMNRATGGYSGFIKPAKGVQQGKGLPLLSFADTAVVFQENKLVGAQVVGLVAHSDVPDVKIVPGSVPPQTHATGIIPRTNSYGDTLKNVATYDCERVLGAGYCNGDVLKPGYYGDLSLDGKDVTLLIGEGFYSFKSINLSAGARLIAMQPNGGRTVVYSQNTVTTSASSNFIGPADAFGATGYGTGHGQFLGGSMMLIGGAGMQLSSSDGSIWATITAPHGEVSFNSQVNIFGQVFAKRIVGANNLDFGLGAYIRFISEVPVIQINRGKPVTIEENFLSPCLNCKDTTIYVSLSAKNSFDVTLQWELLDGAADATKKAAKWGEDYGVPGGDKTRFLPLGVNGGKLVIRKNTLVDSFVIRVKNDSIFSGPRYFRIRLFNPQNARFDTAKVSSDTTAYYNDTTLVTIVDPDPPGMFSFVKLRDTVNEDVGKVSIGVRLSERMTDTAKVDVAVVPAQSSAIANQDYQYTTVRLVFPPGTGGMVIDFDSLKILNDNRDEPIDSLTFILTNQSLGGIKSDSNKTTILILDNDPTRAFRLVDTSVVEGPAGVRKTVWTRLVLADSATGRVISSVDSSSGFDIPFHWATFSRSAKAVGSDTDYVTQAGRWDTLKAGQVSIALPVTILGDNFLENNEYFNVFVDTFYNVVRGAFPDTSSSITILNDDARPAIQVMTDSVAEPDLGQTDTLHFRVRLVDSSSGAPLTAANAPKTTLKYSWSTSNGTAVAPGDYDVVGSTVGTLAPGVLTDILKVVVRGDNRYEGREYMTVTVVPVDSIAAASTTTHILSAPGSIIDDETKPYVCAADTSVNEADANVTSSIRVFLSNSATCSDTLTAQQAPGVPVGFAWTTEGVTATQGKDYTGVAAKPDTVAALTTSKRLSATILGDDVYENKEWFKVSLGSLSNGVGGRLVAYDTIKDDDVAPTIASITSLDSLEGNSGSKIWRFKVKMSAKSEVPAVFTWKTMEMGYTDSTTALSGEDFTAVNTTSVTIPVGSDSTFLYVEVKGDTKYEKDEVFGITVTPVSGITVTGSVTAATGTIRNDDNAPTIASIADVSLPEGNSGTKTFAFKLKLSAPSGLVSYVRWSTVAGAAHLDSAKATEDFAGVPNLTTVMIPVGADSVFLNVTVNGDTKFEKNEAFRVEAVAGTGLTTSSKSAVGTILNDDSVPEIRIYDASNVTEPADSGMPANATFRIALSAKTGVPVVVDWTTVDSSAHVAYKDYAAAGTPVSGLSVTFAQDSDTLKTVTVPVLGDNLDEPTESFRALITSATNAKRMDDTAFAYIVDNDAAPAIHVDPITVDEPSTGSTPANVRVWLDRISGLPVSFSWSTRNGTATFGTKDYDSTAQDTYTIPAGTTSTSGTREITLPVAVRADSVANEGTEKFRVALGILSAYGTDTTDTVYIVDRTPKPNLSIASSDTVVEANVGVPFTITLDRPSATPVKVLVKTVAVTATPGADYVAIHDTITIPALQKTFLDTVFIKDDNRYEDSIETFQVVLDTAWGTSDPNGKSIVVGISDNEPVPTLSITDVTVTEPVVYGNKATARFQITLSGPSERPITVEWTTDTAKAAAHPAASTLDYVATSGMRTFAADQLKDSIDISVLGDSLDEYDETYLVRLSNPTVATIAKDSGIGVITDNDTMPELSIDDPDTVAEGGTIVFTARLERPSAKPVTFVWNTRNGTAQSDSDYVAVVGKSETIPAMSSSITLPVVTKADAVAGEGVENFFVKLTNLVEAGVGDTLGRGLIEDATGKPTLSIDSVGSFSEPKNDSTVVFHVKLSTPSAVAVTVKFTTVSGKAIVGKDLADTTGTLTFAIGETSKYLPVRIIADAFDEEASEDFTVELDNASGAGITQKTGLGVILDDDPTPTLTIVDDTISEPAKAGDVDSAVVKVHLSAPSNLEIRFGIAPDDSTAFSPADYVKVGMTIVFAPGKTDTVFRVAVVGDSLDEEDEWFLVKLQDPVNATLGDADGRVLIEDKDDAPVLSLANASANEGDTAVVTVKLARKSAKDVIFDWRTVDGTALGGLDFKVVASKTDTIEAGETTLELRVPVFADAVANEFNETFRILVTRAVNAALPDSDAVVTIIDRTARPQIRIETAGDIKEDPVFLVFPIKLDRPSAVPVRVRWRTQEGSAKAGLDFKDSSGVLTIAANSVLDSVKVRVLEDALYEPWVESLQVVLSVPESASIAVSSAYGGIVDDNDAPPVVIDSAKPVVEGGSALVPVSLLNVSADTVFVYWRTVDGSAKAPADYVGSSGRLVFLPGETRLNVSVKTVVDTLWEPTENLSVRIDSVKGGFVANGEDSLGMISILEEGAYPTVSFDMRDTSVIESKAGDVPVVVKLSRAASVPLKMGVVVDGASVAVRDLDYALRNLSTDTLLIPALSSSASFVVRVLDDSLDEIDELVRLGFVKVGGPAAVGKTSFDLTILDDDSAPAVRFDVDSQKVPESVGKVTVRANLARPSAKAIDVWFSVGGTATAGGVDHDLKPFHLHFDAGATSATVVFDVVDDVVDEPDETVTVTLDSARNGNLTAATRQIVVILDNDDPPRSRFVDAEKTVKENVGTVSFPISLDHPSSQDVVVRISVRGSANLDSLRKGSDAILDSDVVYQITIPAGDTTATFKIAVINDGRVESTEDVKLSMVGGAGADDKSTSASRLVILDDDKNPVVVITRPADSLRTKDSLQTIRWTWDDVVQPTKDTVLEEGWNRISRCATDTAGNTGCDTVHVWADFTPPRVEITRPDSVFLTNKTGVQVCWTVTDSGATWKRVADPCMDTTLKEGTHTIVRTACDSVGNCGSDQVIVTVDLTPPTGMFLYPPDSAYIRVKEQPARIRWIDDGDTILVRDTLVMSHYGWNTFTATYKDKAGNEGRTSVTVYYQAPQVEDGWYEDSNGDGKVDEVVVEFDSPWESESLPTFTFELGGETRTVKVEKAEWYEEGTRGVPAVDTKGKVVVDSKGDTVYLAPGIAMTDKDGRPVIDGETGKPVTSPVGEVYRDASGKPVYDKDGLEMYRVAGPGNADHTRLVVSLPTPFKYGVTSVSSGDSGTMKVVLPVVDATGKSVDRSFQNTFPLADSVAPIIAKAVVVRTESYDGKDSVYITPSEPIDFDSTGTWVEIKIDGEWHVVPAESLVVLDDGRIVIQVEPGEDGSVRPGLEVRFGNGVSDTSGNAKAPSETKWATKVEGGPRPPLLEMELPQPVKTVPSEEVNTKRKGGFVIRATNKDADGGYQWWKPGTGYTSPSDPSIRDICPDLRYCNGVSVYVNRPVRLFLFVYDLSGTFVIRDEINITQQDIDGLKADKLDRVRIQLQWNMRGRDDQVVGSGIYLWRIVSYVMDPDHKTPAMTNQIVRIGVKSSLR